MVKRHLKRIAMPASWKLDRKNAIFITRPHPGKHSMKHCFALLTAIKDVLKIAAKRKEAISIIVKGECLVDGKVTKEYKYNIGFMDVLSFPTLKKQYRVLLDSKGNLRLKEIDEKEAGKKISQVIGKTVLRENKVQINLSDSRNIIMAKENVAVGDSVVLEVPSQKIIEIIKLDKGNTVLLIGGKHKGEIGEVTSIQGNTLLYKNTSGETYETLKKYAFVVGTKHPAISVGP